MKSFFDLATDIHQYDSVEVDWSKEGNPESPTRKYFNYYLTPKLEVKNLSVLDIGCGFGQLFPVLRDKEAKEIVGIEPSEKNVILAKEKYPQYQIIKSTLEEYEPNRKFDVAVAIMVFEHIGNVSLAFNKIKKILNNGGMFFLIVSDKDYSIKPKFDYHIETENLGEDQIVAKTERNWGTLYDIFRSSEYYINKAVEAGFTLEDHVAICPNEDIVKFMPKYKEFLGVTTAHLLIFRTN